jgi:hypothetical protein
VITPRSPISPSVNPPRKPEGSAKGPPKGNSSFDRQIISLFSKLQDAGIKRTIATDRVAAIYSPGSTYLQAATNLREKLGGLHETLATRGLL